MKKKIGLCLWMLIILFLFTGCSKAKESQSQYETESQKYQQAIQCINDKDYPQAMGILKDLPNYKDSKDLVEQLSYLINGSYISNGIWAVGAITSDGGVEVAYDGEEIDQFSSAKTWENIQSISARGGASIEGLTEEGKIITTSTVTKEELLNSKVPSTYGMADVVEAVSNWHNIASFQTYYPQSAIALTDDGAVYAAYPAYEDSTIKLKGWDNMMSVEGGRGYVVGIKTDGTIISNNYDYSGRIDTSNWTDIVALSAGTSIIGLREDGTVLSTGLNRYGEGDVSDWTDIIAISTWGSGTLGLKNDGTVVSAGKNSYGQLNVEDWTDIVAIEAGEYFTIGLKANGTMVLAGNCSASGVKTPDITGMTGLYVPQIDINN